MASPAGYARSRPARERIIDQIWATLRVASARGAYLSTQDIIDATGGSKSTTKRLLQAARDRGWIEASTRTEPNEEMPGGIYHRPVYRMTSSAPVAAPLLRLDGGTPLAAAIPADITGADLAALRRDRNWTLETAAKLIGVADTRTVRRYETATSLPPRVADAVRRLLATP